jgi:hypothetical protein
MEKSEFMERLVSHASLDTIDFACDLELALADEVRYLRRVIGALAERDASEESILVRELRARLSDKDVQIEELHQENRFLRQRLASTTG